MVTPTDSGVTAVAANLLLCAASAVLFALVLPGARGARAPRR
ncbi:MULTISPECIES: hypothetical protein [Streptomyces]|nr:MULTISPECIES: hypothetical protein [Streptomyces]MDH6228307.1 hypothetical protein [Streptomyces sp. MJP52]